MKKKVLVFLLIISGIMFSQEVSKIKVKLSKDSEIKYIQLYFDDYLVVLDEFGNMLELEQNRYSNHQSQEIEY